MWTHWLCHQHASTRSSPAQIKHWPQKSKKPHGRRSPSHHLLDKNKVTEFTERTKHENEKHSGLMTDCLSPTWLCRHGPVLCFDFLREPHGFLLNLSQQVRRLKSKTQTERERWVTAGQLQQPVNPLSTIWLIRTKLPNIWHFTEEEIESKNIFITVKVCHVWRQEFL